eukprot:COSAG02_NODE_82971_length_101_cov_325736.500000_1_plen_27_part_10
MVLVSSIAPVPNAVDELGAVFVRATR